MSTFTNLGDLIVRDRDLNKVAIIDLGGEQSPREFTYAQLDETANGVARALLRRGLERGDRVAILSPTAPSTSLPISASCAPAWSRCR